MKNVKISKSILCISILSILFSCKNRYEYNSTKIGDQEWMTKNLEITTFRNGDTIPEITTWEEFENNRQTNEDADDWDNRSTIMTSRILKKVDHAPAWCYYNFDKGNGEKYGKLYNRAALEDPRGLAPEGWRLPSINDFIFLRDYLGIQGGGLKLKSKEGWYQSGNGINETGFNAYPGGGLYLNPWGPKGYFDGIEKIGNWMSSDSYIPLMLRYESNELYLSRQIKDNYGRSYVFIEIPMFFSVRCIKTKNE